MYTVEVQSVKELKHILSNKDLKVSRAIVRNIINNLNTPYNPIHVLDAKVKGVIKPLKLVVNRDNVVLVLEKNLKIHEIYEDYESCADIRDIIFKLKGISLNYI